jgi:hypothetical protein
VFIQSKLKVEHTGTNCAKRKIFWLKKSLRRLTNYSNPICLGHEFAILKDNSI